MQSRGSLNKMNKYNFLNCCMEEWSIRAIRENCQRKGHRGPSQNPVFINRVDPYLWGMCAECISECNTPPTSENKINLDLSQFHKWSEDINRPQWTMADDKSDSHDEPPVQRSSSTLPNHSTKLKCLTVKVLRELQPLAPIVLTATTANNNVDISFIDHRLSQPKACYNDFYNADDEGVTNTDTNTDTNTNTDTSTKPDTDEDDDLASNTRNFVENDKIRNYLSIISMHSKKIDSPHQSFEQQAFLHLPSLLSFASDADAEDELNLAGSDKLPITLPLPPLRWIRENVKKNPSQKASFGHHDLPKWSKGIKIPQWANASPQTLDQDKPYFADNVGWNADNIKKIIDEERYKAIFIEANRHLGPDYFCKPEEAKEMQPFLNSWLRKAKKLSRNRKAASGLRRFNK